MTNEERIAKIEQAEKLIREVEFSYPIGHDIRTSLYRLVVNTFSFIGPMPNIVKQIKEDLKKEKEKAECCCWAFDHPPCAVHPKQSSP